MERSDTVNLLMVILKDIVVPELASFISAHYAQTGELPTQEELQAKIDELSTRIVMKGEAFLASLPTTTTE